MPIVILSEEDRDTILDLLQHEVDFSEGDIDMEDSTGIWKRLVEFFEKAPSTVHIAVYCYGGNPERAEAYLDESLAGDAMHRMAIDEGYESVEEIEGSAYDAIAILEAKVFDE